MTAFEKYKFETVSAFEMTTFPKTWRVVKPGVKAPLMTTFPEAKTFVAKTLFVTSAFDAVMFPSVTKLLTWTFVGITTFDDISTLYQEIYF